MKSFKQVCYLTTAGHINANWPWVPEGVAPPLTRCFEPFNNPLSMMDQILEESLKIFLDSVLNPGSYITEVFKYWRTEWICVCIFQVRIFSDFIFIYLYKILDITRHQDTWMRTTPTARDLGDCNSIAENISSQKLEEMEGRVQSRAVEPAGLEAAQPSPELAVPPCPPVLCAPR